MQGDYILKKTNRQKPNFAARTEIHASGTQALKKYMECEPKPHPSPSLATRTITTSYQPPPGVRRPLEPKIRTQAPKGEQRIVSKPSETSRNASPNGASSPCAATP